MRGRTATARGGRGDAATVVVEPRFRINAGVDFAFGPGKAELLEHVARTGSLTEAARAMEMSYMQAWKLVRSLDRAFAEPLVVSVRGGHTRGGAVLSPTGRAVLDAYRALEAAARPASAEAQSAFTKLFAGGR